mmetsp:Transcript_14249/g.30010  ORF Transcript_14249/g.30010 Transcript_14249/m.30010 type:complete len:559 (+) Transcript_14249:606-2282(+)
MTFCHAVADNTRTRTRTCNRSSTATICIESIIQSLQILLQRNIIGRKTIALPVPSPHPILPNLSSRLHLQLISPPNVHGIISPIQRQLGTLDKLHNIPHDPRLKRHDPRPRQQGADVVPNISFDPKGSEGLCFVMTRSETQGPIVGKTGDVKRVFGVVGREHPGLVLAEEVFAELFSSQDQDVGFVVVVFVVIVVVVLIRFASAISLLILYIILFVVAVVVVHHFLLLLVLSILPNPISVNELAAPASHLGTVPKHPLPHLLPTAIRRYLLDAGHVAPPRQPLGMDDQSFESRWKIGLHVEVGVPSTRLNLFEEFFEGEEGVDGTSELGAVGEGGFGVEGFYFEFLFVGLEGIVVVGSVIAVGVCLVDVFVGIATAAAGRLIRQIQNDHGLPEKRGNEYGEEVIVELAGVAVSCELVGEEEEDFFALLVGSFIIDMHVVNVVVGLMIGVDIRIRLRQTAGKRVVDLGGRIQRRELSGIGGYLSIDPLPMLRRRQRRGIGQQLLLLLQRKLLRAEEVIGIQKRRRQAESGGAHDGRGRVMEGRRGGQTERVVRMKTTGR